ncbi:MAG: SusD/RagB family nutrient-binding outer membrane lipoprotein [Bacteroidota bacterium]|nr:SusD/RagB family nutrient-binding outer membrane lipoprotein [Bacteroidota bacterium]
MKKTNFKIITFILLSANLMFSSCTKKIDAAYQNPNALTVEPIESLLPGVIGNFLGNASSAGSGYGLGGDATIIGRYIQYWNNYAVTSSDNGGTQYDQMGGTVGGSDLLGSVWAMFYYGQGQNLNRIIEWGAQQQKWDYVGVAQAIRAWGWLEMVNQYNSIILKQAFNTGLQQFNYDDPSEVYDTVRATCYRALTNLNRTDGAVSQSNLAIGDAYMNNGDVNKWKKFVYGVLARSYQYLSNKSAYTANHYADSAIYYANLGPTVNADNITLKFAAKRTSGTSNYFGPFRGNVGSLRQSAYVANLLSGLNSTAFTGVNDPRAWYLIRENSNGTFKGVQPGQGSAGILTPDLPKNFWGNPFTSIGAPTADSGRYLFRDSAQFPVMTASEMQFIVAEAAYRKGDKATALSAYVNAISLNFDMLANQYAFNVPSYALITPGSKSAYLANPSVVPINAGDLTLTQIMLQKYIALYGWGSHETWVDMRRFHYTDLDPVTGKQVYADFVPGGGTLYINNNGKFVYRARPRYNSEYLYDVPSLQKVGALNLDYHTYECWFSQQ